uniref:Uncharacterized protein n=1 Tax=Setaria italica TaxID=4555 RepID=K3XXG5_SETIT
MRPSMRSSRTRSQSEGRKCRRSEPAARRTTACVLLSMNTWRSPGDASAAAFSSSAASRHETSSATSLWIPSAPGARGVAGDSPSSPPRTRWRETRRRSMQRRYPIQNPTHGCTSPPCGICHVQWERTNAPRSRPPRRAVSTRPASAAPAAAGTGWKGPQEKSTASTGYVSESGAYRSSAASSVDGELPRTATAPASPSIAPLLAAASSPRAAACAGSSSRCRSRRNRRSMGAAASAGRAHVQNPGDVEPGEPVRQRVGLRSGVGGRGEGREEEEERALLVGVDVVEDAWRRHEELADTVAVEVELVASRRGERGGVARELTGYEVGWIELVGTAGAVALGGARRGWAATAAAAVVVAAAAAGLQPGLGNDSLDARVHGARRHGRCGHVGS